MELPMPPMSFWLIRFGCWGSVWRNDQLIDDNPLWTSAIDHRTKRNQSDDERCEEQRHRDPRDACDVARSSGLHALG